MKALGVDLDLEKLSTYKDYLNLSSNKTFEDILFKFDDPDYDGYCLTDHIYILNKKLKRSRVKIAITEKFIYLIKGKNTLKLKKKYDLRILRQVAISTKNHTLALLTFGKSNHLLIDSYRRVDIILYILLRMKKGKYPNFFKILFLKNFKFSSSKSVMLNDIDSKLKSNKGEMLILQETFKNVKKSGYLKIWKKKFFKMTFVEYFFLLSNIGLIYFKNFGVKIYLN